MSRIDRTFRPFAWYRKLRGGRWIALGYTPQPVWFRAA